MSPTQSPFRFNEERHGAILAFVNRCGIVSKDHLVTLTGKSPRQVERTTTGLIAERYLYAKRRHFHKNIYSIDYAALSVLRRRGVPDDHLNKVRLSERSELFLDHDLQVVDVHVALERACEGSPFQLSDWREGKKALYERVTFTEDGGETTLPFYLDAFFTLTDSHQRPLTAALLDVLHKTEYKDFENKIKACHHAFAQGVHQKKFGVDKCLVIFPVVDPDRIPRFCEIAAALLPPREAKFYYFAPFSYFANANPAHVFGKIFVSARDYQKGKRYQLLPPLAASPCTSYTKREGVLTPAAHSRVTV